MADEQTLYADPSNWNKIVLWGRLQFYPGSGWSYRWDFGDGHYDPWRAIVNPDSVLNAPLSGSSRYLKSSIKSDYPVPSLSQPVDFYVARLEITPDGGTTVYPAPNGVRVTVVNMRGINEANGYDRPSSKIQRRTIIEAIAKGRGLRYIYLMQKPLSGSWQNADLCYWDKMNIYGDNYFTGVTAISLCAFLIYGHGVDTTVATDDIFVETVNSGFNFLGTQAHILSGPDRIGFYSTWFQIYEHGITMLALGAATGFKKYVDAEPMVYRDSNLSTPVPLFKSTDLEGYKFGDILRGAVDFAAASQKTVAVTSVPDESKYFGGWRYYPGYTETYASTTYANADLSCSQWPTLGLTAIYENWKINPDPSFHVRDEMLNYLRFCQFRSDEPDPDTSPDGYCWYDRVSTPTAPGRSYTDNELFDHTPPISDVTSVSIRLTAVNSFLQMCYYMSLDDNSSNPVPGNYANTCYCSNTGACTDQRTDFKINRNDTMIDQSCERVKHAFDFMARFIKLENFDNYYTLYGNMKALRLYNIQRMDCTNNPGLHGGILYHYGNFTYPLDTRLPYDWEQEYIQLVLRDGPSRALNEKTLDAYGAMAWSVGLYYDGFVAQDDYNRCLETSFAMLLLAPTVFEATTLRTELPVSKFDKLSFKGKDK
jgi:hypothetical protein